MRSRLTLPWCRTHVRPSRWRGILLLLLILGLAAGAPTPTQAESTTRTVSLSAGWSAVVYTGPDVAATTVAADLGADVLTVWDAVAQQYDTFYPALPAALNSLQTLASGTVVLLQLPTAGSWTMAVLPVSPVMTVQAGWNLLPWAPATARSVADAVAPLGSRLQGLYRLTAAGTFDSYLPALPAPFVTLTQVNPLDALWVSVGAGPPIPWAQVDGGATTDTATASEGQQAVVYIESEEIGGSSCGSGVVISPTQVLTAAHVVADATTITLRFDEESIRTGEVTGIDTASDLAVVTVAGGVPATLTPLPWAQTNRVNVGSDLWIWGFPQCWDLNDLFVAANPTLTRGIVSAVQTDADGSVLLQTDAALNPGNSGGPWLTPDGVVVGLTSWGLTDSEGLGFAYSLVDHQTVMDALLASDTPVVTADPTPVAATVSNISFVASTAAFCDLSRPLGPSHNLRASDLGLCLVATYDMAAGTELRLFWTLDGTALCDETGGVTASDIRGETLLYCDPPALHSGIYALTIQHNGQTVGSHSQYITRDAVSVSVSDMAFLALAVDGCGFNPLGLTLNLAVSDLGLCLEASYDMPAGTELTFRWTLDGTSLCTQTGVPSDRMLRGETLVSCTPTTALGTGTYALTIQHNGQTVGSHSQYITRDPSAPAEVIAFASDRDGAFEIYTMRPDGTDVRQLTENDVWDAEPAWSPDGTRIAFMSGLEIYTMRSDGTGVRRLTDNRLTAAGIRAYDLNPAWSPDGTRIVFDSDRDGGDVEDREIYTIRSDGTDMRQLTVSDDWTGQAAWSPDGTRIAFMSARDGFSSIYTMRTDGTDVRKLTNKDNDVGVDLNPVWSPDGTRIVFDSMRISDIYYGKDNDNRVDVEIYSMRPDGTDVRQLTQTDAEDRSPAWSPDGTRIAFASDRDGDFEIYTMRSDGTDVRQLTVNDTEDSDPAWSP